MKAKTSLWGLASCSTGSRKRKADEEEESKSATGLGLVACTTPNKGEVEPKLGNGEGQVGVDGDGVNEISEWEQSFWSQFSDHDLTSYLHNEEEGETFEDYLDEWGLDPALCDPMVLLDYRSRYDCGRMFRFMDKQRDRLVVENAEKVVVLTVQVNKLDTITHESSADDVFEKLKNDGLSIEKNLAMPWIQRSIQRRLHFHQLERRFELVKRMITVVPCIKRNADEDQMIKFIRQAGLADDLPEEEIEYAIIEFTDILFLEDEDVGCGLGFYHPVIRKERIKCYFERIKREYKKNRRRIIQDWNTDVSKPYDEYIKREEEKNKSEKEDALKVVKLHQEFHEHVTSCQFITHDMKVKELIKDKRVVDARFEGLDRTLIKASLKTILSVLKAHYEFETYESWMQGLVDDKLTKGRSSMDEILDKIRATHPNFPQLSNNWTFTNLKSLPHDWSTDQMQDEISSFYELLREVKEYTKCHASCAYMIEGILTYLDYCSGFEEEPGEMMLMPKFQEEGHKYSCFPLFPGYMEEIWDEPFHYDHEAYTTAYEDMSTLIF